MKLGFSRLQIGVYGYRWTKKPSAASAEGFTLRLQFKGVIRATISPEAAVSSDNSTASELKRDIP
jgi:hypothetical protein